MKRRPARKSRPSASSDCLAVMCVDGTAIRRKVRQQYEKVLRDLTTTRHRLDQFHRRDLPRFTRWLSTRFGALLTELRSAGHRVQELEILLEETATEVLLTGAHPGRAYQRVLRRRQDASSRAERGDDEGPESSFDPRSGPREEAEGDSDPKATGGAGSRRGAKHARLGSDAPGQSPKPRAGRLKEIYRAVVRMLHPDRQTRMTAQKLEWWHEAQAAYESGDVEKLEVIQTLCDIEADGSPDQASLAVLQRLTAEFRQTLRRLRAQLTRCRSEMAWNFSQRTDLAELERIVQRQLQRDLLLIKERQRALEDELAPWTEEAKGRPRGSRYGRRWGR